MLTVSPTKLAQLEKERQERVVSAAVIAAGLEAMGVPNERINSIIELFGNVLRMRYRAKHNPKLKTSPWYLKTNDIVLECYQSAVTDALSRINFLPQDWVKAGRAMQKTIKRARAINYPVRHLCRVKDRCG